ncbi:hypothetical protein BX600DRAFT_447332 [Xylariales sp. PMI_506]|nr:hypothetical protein BX600DRAFT_447332 [Xylariales sp. PMI_506]
MDFERYLSLRARMQSTDKSQSVTKYAYTEIVELEGKAGNPSVVIQKSDGSRGRDRDSLYGEYAIVSRDHINVKGENDKTELQIQSEIMQTALRSIFGKHSQVGTRADPIVFRKPFYPLFHCRKEIRNLAENESTTAEQKQHLKWLITFMSDNFQDLEKVQEGLVDKGLVDFRNLPIIFEAGSIVVGQLPEDSDKAVKRDKAEKTERPECFLFHEISDEIEDKMTGAKYVDVKVFRWGFNGSMFGLTSEKLKIKEFLGPRKITELECFPLKYLDEDVKNVLVPRLISRGEKWCDYLEATSFEYKGAAQVPTRSNWSWDVKIIPKNMPGRVILDYLAFMEAFPELSKPLHNKPSENSEEKLPVFEELSNHSNVWEISSEISIPRGGLWGCCPKKNYRPTPAQALLCPASSPGYSLAQKDWGYFDVDLLREVEWAENPIQDLEINSAQRDILLDLIIQHHSNPWSQDIVSRKGEGLIFLLYGPPGCGKTLTAELLAEQDKRALLRISSGDLGQHPYDVDRNLESLLKLAVRGSMIVLIDEADTFLAKRTTNNGISSYFHNATVAIFLKHLEYFPGVVFLTTNQGTDIDDAVSSRIIPLQYGPLNASSRAKIWKTQLLKDTRGIELGMEELNSICEEFGDRFVLDGREIKTLAQLSLNICKRRNQGVTRDIVQQLFDLTHGSKSIMT